MGLMQDEHNLDVEAMVNEFEKKLERLRVLYEQYFMGIEKREPQVLMKDVVRTMHALDQVQIRNTGLRYRYRTLVQRLNVYRTYWSRNLRAIENGTFFRDVAKASRNLAQKGLDMAMTGKVRSVAAVERAVTSAVKHNENAISSTPLQESVLNNSASVENSNYILKNYSDVSAIPSSVPSAGSDPGVSLSPINLGEEEYGVPLKSTVAIPHNTSQQSQASTKAFPLDQAPRSGTQASINKPLRSSPPGSLGRNTQMGGIMSYIHQSTGMTESDLQSLYRRFIRAKEMCGEETTAIKYENLMQSIARQLPKIATQNKGRQVMFQVVIRDGHAILRTQGK